MAAAAYLYFHSAEQSAFETILFRRLKDLQIGYIVTENCTDILKLHEFYVLF